MTKLLLIAFCATLGMIASIELPATPQAGTAASRIMVHPGDTLWSIAAQAHVNEDDLRDAVDRIMSDNGLASAEIQPGQILIVRL